MGLRSIFRTILGQDPEFKPHWQVASETYVKTAGRVHSITEQEVISAAAVLESAYSMSEEIPPDQLIALSMTRAELHAFVSYMRQLDNAYREQGKFIAKHIHPLRSPGEFETVEETAQVSAECYEQLTGQSARPAASRQHGK